MRETVPRIQRVYIRFEDAGQGMMRLAASLTPPAFDEPVMVLLSRGVMPAGQPISLLLVSDPTQNAALHGKAASVRIGSVAAGPAGSPPKVVNRGSDTDAVLDFTLPAPKDGAPGQSAYQAAQAAGYGGTQAQWLASLAAPAPAPAGAMLGTITIAQTATVAIAVGVRRVSVTIPAGMGVALGDPLILCPTTALPGYALHDVVAVSATSLSIGLTGPLLAIGASFSITARLFRLTA